MGRKVIGHRGPGWLAASLVGRGPSWKGTARKSAIGRIGVAYQKAGKSGGRRAAGRGGRAW